MLTFLSLFKRVFLGVWKLGQWREKWVIVSSFLSPSHNGFRLSWKQYLNLWSWRWVRPRQNLVRGLMPYGLWISKILFARGFIKFKKFFLKVNFPIKVVPLRYSRMEEWVLKSLVSYMSCRIIIATCSFMNSIQVRNQIE